MKIIDADKLSEDLEKIRRYLVERQMYGAEHVVAHYVEQVVDRQPGLVLEEIPDDERKLASACRIVLDMLKECDMFCGIYDAKNGDDHFMHGIMTVMENIAYCISEEEGDRLSSEFCHNMDASKNVIKEM